MTYGVDEANAYLKERYAGQDVSILTNKSYPFLNSIPKSTDYSGKSLPLPATYADVAGVSSTFAAAQAATIGTKDVAFAVTMAKKYGVATISDEVMRMSRDDKGAFIKALDHQMASAMRSMSRAISIGLFMDQNQNRAQVGSISTVSLTLKNIRDVNRFQVGDYIGFSQTAGGAIAGNGSGIAAYQKITGINSITGVLTGAADWSGAAFGGSTDYYIFVYGDGALASTATGIAGLPAWNNTSGSSSFFGADTRASTLLHGLQFDGSSLGMEESIIGGCQIANNFGIVYDHVIMHPYDVTRLINSMSSKVVLPNMIEQGRNSSNEPTAALGFNVIVMPNNVKIISDPHAHQSVAWAVAMDNLKLWSAGPAPGVADGDSLTLLRAATSMDYELRLTAYCNFTSQDTRSSCAITLPS